MRRTAFAPFMLAGCMAGPAPEPAAPPVRTPPPAQLSPSHLRELVAGQALMTCLIARKKPTNGLADDIKLARKKSEELAACTAEAALLHCIESNEDWMGLVPYQTFTGKTCEEVSVALRIARDKQEGNARLAQGRK